MTAGAERVLFYPDETDLVVDYAGLGVRVGDILLMVDPTLLSSKELAKVRDACGGNVMFQVVGHEPVALKTPADIAEFRALPPTVKQTAITRSTGRPPKIKHTIEQADAIIRLWHDVPRRKPADICRMADAILGLPDGTIKPYWVRDLVTKYVGTAQREKPEGWRGVRID